MVCRAPAGGVVGVWARHAVPLRVGDGVPWANGWCCGGLGTAGPCPYVRSSPLRLCALCAFALTSFALNGVPWADGWCCGGLGTAARCPYVRSSPLRLCALCVFALNGVPWADGWCCGGLGTAARCPYVRSSPLRLCALCVFALNGVPWADGWCCGGLGTAARCPYGWRPLRLCVNVLCVKRCAVRRRVALWGFGHGSAVGRRVVLWGFGHGSAVPLRAFVPSAPLRPLRLCVKRCAVG